MLGVYGYYKYVYSYCAGIDCRRQNLTSKVDPRAVRIKGLIPGALHSKIIIYDVQLLEVVSRYRDPQLQVAENYEI